MPEPVATAAGIASLLLSSYALSKAVYESIDGIKHAPKHLLTISRDSKDLYSVFGTLRAHIDDHDNAAGVLHPATSVDLEVVLNNCITIFKELGEFVAEFVKNDGSLPISKWQSMRSTWRDKEITRLKEHLTAHKCTLNLAVAAANL